MKILRNILYCTGTNNDLHLNIKPAFHKKNSFEKRLKFRRDFIIYRKKKTKKIKIFKIWVEKGVSHRNVACVFFCLERKWDRMAQVFRVERNKNFTVMSNHHFKNKNLSLKAKGLLSLMLSLPEDWNYNMQGLATLSRDGIDHGYGNMKTATRCFPSGVARYDKEPIFQNNLPIFSYLEESVQNFSLNYSNPLK